MASVETLHFRAMGSPSRVVVAGRSDNLVEQVEDLIRRLEALWSRFLESSEISALNQRSGRIVIVSEETYKLVECAVQAQQKTHGLFNPLMLSQLENNGYRQSWDDATPEPDGEPTNSACVEPIVLYPALYGVQIPEGTKFDPGGIGKGLAIDLAIELCQAANASTASVEIGGDLRVYGTPWYGDVWNIGVANPYDSSQEFATFTPTQGAVTTSSTHNKSWTYNAKRFHHILDPATGAPSTQNIVAVTTCASLAWWSEVVAKSTIIVGSARAIDFLNEMKTPGAAITSDGEILVANPKSGPEDRLRQNHEATLAR